MLVNEGTIHVTSFPGKGYFADLKTLAGEYNQTFRGRTAAAAQQEAIDRFEEVQIQNILSMGSASYELFVDNVSQGVTTLTSADISLAVDNTPDLFVVTSVDGSEVIYAIDNPGANAVRKRMTINQVGAATANPATLATHTEFISRYAALVRATSVAYAATVTPNADTTDVLNIGALTGALTLAAPTGTPRDGQNLRVRFVQDATGGRAITYNAIFAFGSDVQAAQDPTVANAKWERLFVYHAGDATWRATAIVRGF